MKLTIDEKKYLWSKIEFKKKKTAKENENELYHLLNNDNETFSEDEFLKILNSLEYSFKKKLKTGIIKNENFKSLKNKLPDSWIDVKYSVISAKNKRDNKKPTKISKKSEIINYLQKKNIDFDSKSKKADLLKLFKNENIKTFYGFITN